jgi:hypothetical protein
MHTEGSGGFGIIVSLRISVVIDRVEVVMGIQPIYRCAVGIGTGSV